MVEHLLPDKTTYLRIWCTLRFTWCFLYVADLLDVFGIGMVYLLHLIIGPKWHKKVENIEIQRPTHIPLRW